MKTVKLNQKEEMYVLDTSRIKTVEDIVAVLKCMNLAIPYEIYQEGIPKETKKYFRKTSLSAIESNLF